MKNLIIIIVMLLSVSPRLWPQGAAINSTGLGADPSAILDISSTNSGFLIPRMTENQKNAILSPATGLMVYQTDGVAGFWYYNGITWIQAIGPTGATGATGANGANGPTGPTGAAPVCSASTGETLLRCFGCLYVKNTDETGTYTWTGALAKCASLGNGWYLPTQEELSCIFNCKAGFEQPALSDFNSTYYWSSTACGNTQALTQHFSYADRVCSDRNVLYGVRCVRR